MRILKKHGVVVSLLLSMILLAAGPAYAALLYFPHIAANALWQTEIAVINTGVQTVTGTLNAYSNEGQLVDSKAVTVSAHGRRQINVSDEFTNHTSIGYIIFDTNFGAIEGYAKFFREGIYRAAVPAVKEVNASPHLYVPHIASDTRWWTGISLVNTASETKNLTILFNNDQYRQITLNAHEHKAFDIASLFDNQPKPEIQSAWISNASGVIGLEIFGSTDCKLLDGILLTDKNTSTLYYPHVAGNEWRTGIVAYNPTELLCTMTITPYDAQGNVLAASTVSITGHQYAGTVAGLGLPAQTAWFRIESTRPISVFGLFSTTDGNCLAAYAAGGAIGEKEGIFPKIEKDGWTGIALVNTEDTKATVTLTAYDDNGTAAAVQLLTVGGHAKVSDLAEAIFLQDISNATYIAYSSDREVAGFQLNGSLDGTMLDGLPALPGVGPPSPVWQQTAGPEGGIVWSVAVDPANSRVAYAGTQGGVFKTTDGGASWTAINNGMTVYPVYSLAIDPADSRIVYAGTYNNITGGEGGLFKTTDGGASWTAINNGITNKRIFSLAIDPSNNQVVYAGAMDGLFKTTDGGASWISINRLGSAWVRSLVIDPANSRTLYAGTWGQGIFKTTDGGLSWTEVNTGIKVLLVYSLAIDPVDSRVVYVGTYSGDSSGGGGSGDGSSSTILNGGVFKTTDGGASWTGIRTGITCASLAIDPANRQVVYADTDGGVMKTIDGGTSWTTINTGFSRHAVQILAVDPADGRTVYAGTYGNGVFKTSDGGDAWKEINTGITSSSVMSLAIDAVNSQTGYAGTISGVFKTTNGGAFWKAINSGITAGYVRSLAIDPVNRRVVYAGTGGGVFKTTNGGASWKAINTGLSHDEIYSLIVDPVNTRIVYAVSWGGLFKTTDGGASWKAIKTGMESSSVWCLAMDPVNSRILYAGTNRGVFKTTDGGKSWTAVTGDTNGYVASLAIDPADSRIVYAGLVNGDAGLFKTTDGGASWKAINTGFMNAGITINDIYSLAVDPQDSRVVYANNDGEVYKTTNGGASWRTINANMKNRYVQCLAIDPANTETVYAGTNGGGVFKTME